MSRIARTWDRWMLLLIGSLIFAVAGLGPRSTASAQEKKEEPAATKKIERRAVVIRKLNIAPAAKNAASAAAPANNVAPAGIDKAAAVATHRQSSIVQVNTSSEKPLKMVCFCLTPDDRILAGGMAETGEIRVFDADGKYVETWKIPVNPEAIYARDDGAIFVAGEGQVVKLSPTGAVELKKQGPHAAALQANPEKLREEVIAQAKQRAEQLGRQAKLYDQMIERADTQIAAINEQLAALKNPVSEAPAEEADATAKKPATGRQLPRDKSALERQLAIVKQQKAAYENAKKSYAQVMKSQPSGELTDAQIDEQVKASMVSKQKASSISATGSDVYLATRAAAGYGFDIWRMDDEFGGGELIVKELRGCCGQMDVKANKDGIFVAENSRHRVCRFDRDGKELLVWGFGARTGLEGFGSCCNPMNVAFGPEGAVYTAEDDTGRIKRYSVDGKLLGLVGAVELKPGCKNVSIAVSKDGSRVYMLDITRNHLVRMDARPAEEVAADVKAMKDAPPAAKESEAAANTSASNSSNTSRGVLGGLRALFVPRTAPSE
jgi:hypothetical protein